MTRTCRQCGREFELTDAEIAFFNRKGLDLPKRCQECRNKNRAERQSCPVVAEVRVSRKESWWSPAKIAVVAAVCVMLLLAGGLAVMQAMKKPAEPERMITEELVTETTPQTEAPESVTELVTELLTEAETEETTEVLPAETAAQATTEKAEVTYILNTYRKKFHRPDCESVAQMNAKNRKKFYGTRQEAIDKGYDPCHNCNP